jgi:hypothetical protein
VAYLCVNNLLATKFILITDGILFGTLRIKSFSSKVRGHIARVNAIKAYRCAEVYLHKFLASTPDGDWWSSLRPGHFTAGTESLFPLKWRQNGPQSEPRYSAPSEIQTTDNPVCRLVVTQISLSRFIVNHEKKIKKINLLTHLFFQCHHMSLMDFVVSLPVVADV